MCNKEQLVSYLYDDVDGAERALFERHLRACAECRGELAAMRAVRADLVAWSPAQPDFGFRVVRESKVVAPGWRGWWTPAAGLAAAAVLVLAVAAAIARVEVRTGPDGLVVRTGWSTAAPASAGLTDAASAPDAAAPARRDVALPADAGMLAGIERRLDALEAATRDSSAVRNASTQSARASDAELIRRVRSMLAQSETKQQGELALRIAQVIRDVDAQRVADLNRIQQGLGRIDASVTAEANAHRELTNYILTSSKQK